MQANVMVETCRIPRDFTEGDKKQEWEKDEGRTRSVGLLYCKESSGSADFKVFAGVCGMNINIQPDCTELDSPVELSGRRRRTSASLSFFHVAAL